MMKSFQFKLFKNKRKDQKLNDELYVFCKIYNHCLCLVKRHYKIFGKNPSKNKLQKHLRVLMNRGIKPEWKSLGYSQAIQDVTDRIYKSYQAFFAWCKKRSSEKKSPPKFKAFRKYKSFTLKQAGWKLDEEKGMIKIGKNYYRYNNSRNIEGRVKTVTIKRDQVGEWYIILSCDLGESYKPEKVIPMTGKSAGFDFGLSCFLTSSKNEKINSPEFLKQSLSELKSKSKKLSTKDKGSKNRKKARKVVARLHKKIANQREDFHFKLANDLVNKYDYLFFEDLNVSGMKRVWGRKVSDLGLDQFLKKVQFKAKEHGKTMKRIDRFYPSSKTCSKCTKVKKELALKDRHFHCNCGHQLDRDLNAALNILIVGASTIGLDGVSREFALASVA
ncbi:MAG: transposase [Rickettsiaceae bacterium]|nr:transposase [Rickettsiaceae bacterium]